MANLKYIKEALSATQSYLHKHGHESFEEDHGIRVRTDDHHMILDYDQRKVDWNQPYGYVCRGLVLDVDTYTVLGFGAHKFFNLGEQWAPPIDWNSAKVFEKVDGTMVKRWASPATGRFEYSTRFQLPGDIATNEVQQTGYTWAELIEKCLGDLPDTLNQRPDETLVFEIMSPANKVVVDHKHYHGALLLRRNNITLEEMDLTQHPLAPKVFHFSSQKETLDFLKQVKGSEQEGFVVVDGAWQRIKLKSGEYVRLHHLKDSATSSLKNLILVVKHGETEEVSSYFPEYAESLGKIHQGIEALIQEHEAAWEELKDISVQKDFALAVQAKNLRAPHLLFSVRAGKAPSIREHIEAMPDSSYLKWVYPYIESLNIRVLKTKEE